MPIVLTYFIKREKKPSVCYEKSETLLRAMCDESFLILIVSLLHVQLRYYETETDKGRRENAISFPHNSSVYDRFD